VTFRVTLARSEAQMAANRRTSAQQDEEANVLIAQRLPSNCGEFGLIYRLRGRTPTLSANLNDRFR
jgi:hypothetical protein